LRELTVARESLSAQLADLLDAPLRPTSAHTSEATRPLFAQVRRGGFKLGRHYRLSAPISYVLGEDHPDTLVTASTGGYVVSDGWRHDL
jgi:hypothetical protein